MGLFTFQDREAEFIVNTIDIARKWKTGCLIFKGHNICSTGYQNGGRYKDHRAGQVHGGNLV